MIRPPSFLKYTICGALLLASVAALLCLWRAWCEFPIYSWNEARLAPAFALRHGINPYPLIGEGPLSTWIYGPGGILINLPAAFASSAPGALQVACLINFLVLIGPLAWIFFQSRELHDRGLPVRWLALALAVLLIPRPNLVLQVADHTAIAFGLFSCWFLTRYAVPSRFDLACAAGASVVALWSKQIEVFLVAAQLVYLFLTTDRLAASKYLFWLAGFGVLSLSLVVWYFGWDHLWLNLVVVPGRLPWVGDIADRIAMRPWSLLAQIVVPSLALTGLRFTRHWPKAETGESRFFLMMIFAYIAMLPVGLAAYLKIGGDTNLFHSWDYLLPGCLLIWLAADKMSAKTQACGILAVTLFCLVLRRGDILSLPRHPFTGHFEAAEKMMATHPHRLWFPRNPLITFYADGQLWHSEDGVQTRFLADFGIRQVDFRRYLPPDIEGFVYPSAVEVPFSKPLLMEFNHSTRLPFWTLFTRSQPEPAPKVP